jgi:glucuronate isomerase
MKAFLDENFLLESKVAEELYHTHAAKMPIIDYHCHLPPNEIADDKKFKSITEIWLNGDHYKWRAMRTNGVSEKFCTGDASDYEKFQKWAETVPFTIRNPLYHWTHMELKNPFGVHEVLNGASAKAIFDKCNEKLQQDAFSVRNLLTHFNVKVICTTDDPVDDLVYHQKIRKDGFAIKVLPTFRPDKILNTGNSKAFLAYVQQLADVSNVDITNYTTLIEAFKQRHDFFHENGCRLSDHGLEKMIAEDYTTQEVEAIFLKLLQGKAVNAHEALQFQSAVLYDLALFDHEKGWTQQFHLGALRNNNSRMMRILGPDTGFDSIGDFSQAVPLAKFLDRLDSSDHLPKTILYNLNPRDNEVMATMAGNFNDGSTPGKIQYGSAWWFLDQKDGMEKQMNALSNLGLLSRFVGMLTDSRSFLSYSRHDYFRRILCNLLGKDVANGELPEDMDWLGQVVENICYNNANEYFQFEK